MMMNPGGMEGPQYPPPTPPGKYTDKKFEDEMTAHWERTPLPDDAVVTHVTMIPYRGEKAVLGWRTGLLVLPEGKVAKGESAEDAINRIMYAQTGAKSPAVHHLGHYRVTASARSTTRAPGSVTYHALYALEISEYDDFPGDQSFERRFVLQRDLNTVIRNGLIEHRLEYTHALDAWLMERIKAKASSS